MPNSGNSTFKLAIPRSAAALTIRFGLRSQRVDRGLHPLASDRRDDLAVERRLDGVHHAAMAFCIFTCNSALRSSSSSARMPGPVNAVPLLRT